MKPAKSEYLTVALNRREITRIFAKIAIDSVTGCWNWTGQVNDKGYGMAFYRQHRETFHRLMYAWLVSPIPRGGGRDIPTLDHEVCNNRRCGNPAHLTLTSLRKNILRGSSPSALNARKTHCIRGHLLPLASNHSNRLGGMRRCLACCRIQYHASRLIQKGDKL